MFHLRRPPPAQRHALRKWRFRPATRDGVAVASTKVLTVRFTLNDR